MKKLLYTIVFQGQEATAAEWIVTIGRQAVREGWEVLLVAQKSAGPIEVPSGIQFLKTSICHPSCISTWVCSEEYTYFQYSEVTERFLAPPAKILVYTVAGRTPEFLPCVRLLFHSFRAFHPGAWYDLALITDLDCQELCTEYMIHRIQTPPMNTAYEASATKLNLYTLFDTSQYEAILYLDSDILLRGSLRDVLEGAMSEEDGIFHLVQEGLLSNSNYCGTTGAAFAGLTISKTDPGYSAGLFAWRNGPKSRALLEAMRSISKPGEGCLEQPYVNRILWETKAARTTLLQTLVSSKPEILANVINHFCGSIGDGRTKSQRMLAFLDKML
jgi:hypothetical protein